MYRVRFEGSISQAEKDAIMRWVPGKVNEVISKGVTVGDALLARWFGNDAIPAGTGGKSCKEKREKLSDYMNNRCQVISFVKKIVGQTVDSAKVETHDLAQVMRSCFGHGKDDFVPSGVRVYVLGQGLINQTVNEQFNTIVHELSHRVVGTTDFIGGRSIYGRSAALQLARENSAGAVDCAENWGYFYQELMENLP